MPCAITTGRRSPGCSPNAVIDGGGDAPGSSGHTPGPRFAHAPDADGAASFEGGEPMPLRDRLTGFMGRRPEPEPEPEPEPAAPASAEPAPPPAEPAPRPRIVLLGTEPRAIGLIEIYGLAGGEDVALSDRRPGREAGEVHGHRV